MTTPLLGLRVLVVEDEALISMMITGMLEDLGCCVAAPAPTVQEALDCVGSISLDAAVLDLNLAGQSSYPVADALTRLDTPFVFATGYDAEEINEEWNGVSRVLKPFVGNELGAALSLAVRARSELLPGAT